MHRRDGKLIVAATDLVGFLECGHLTTLDRAAAAGLIHKPDRSDDPEVELLQRRGAQHEQRYINQLHESDHVITDLSGHKDDSYEVQAQRTVEAMRRGDDVIYQATVFDGRWIGYPDFLLKVPGITRSDSIVGGRPPGHDQTDPGTKTGLGTDWHYEVADTKLAHSAKASALIQICSYVDQITNIQGVRPEKVYVVTGGATVDTHPFRTAEMMAYYRHAKQRFEQTLQTELDINATYPDPVEHCAVCRWYPFNCRVQWREDDALPLVAGITRSQRQELKQLGVSTRGALATRPADLKGFERVIDQARLQVLSDGKPIPVFELLPPERDSAGVLVSDRGLSALPEVSKNDLFFDIEGDPFAFWEGLEYLFGIWESGTGETIWDQGRYQGYWAMDRAAEKQAFEQVIDLFIERWRADPTMHIYHYGVYEPAHLKHLAGRHATKEEELDQLLRGRVFVDLYRVVQQGVRVGAERYSIKNLEPLYGFTRTIDLRDANHSIVEFERLLEIGDPSGELKALIQGYNQDDCVSTEKLRNWLEGLRTPDLPRPALGAEQPLSEQLSEWIQRVNDLTERLTGSITKIDADQTKEDKATWLVAHLLDWHRREDKSMWWHYYDLIEKSDDELLDEEDAIAQLTLEERTDPGGRSRSYVYRYRFPPQEVALKLDYADDPALGPHKKTGEIVALDEDAGIVDIRRAKTWTGPHPKSIVQVIVIPATEQQKALFALGEWVAANGIDSESTDYQAARDLLLRKAPRAGQSADAPLNLEGEPGSAAALRLATQLDGTALAIQGPPGSGKTYIGARMIHELVRAGRRVGITSNSHKVISNMIEAVLDAGGLRVIQKAKPHEAFGHSLVRQTDDAGDVAPALAAKEVDVAAGTPWLWSREDMRGAVDTLFVDEAGQVSLANVVAMGGSARNIVLLGDPQQLDQPTQGLHPDGAGVSALGHFLGDEEVVSLNRGLFFERTYRMHPSITEYTSDLFYEGILDSVPGLESQVVGGSDEWAGSGLRWVPVEHDGNTNESVVEAEKVAEIWHALIGRSWTDGKGKICPITPKEIVIVSPFNAHRVLIQKLLGPTARVGTVDKFQGQEAAVSIYTMATSRPEDAPRGMNFLYNLHRLNVATSRAKALAIVVANPRLLNVIPGTPLQLRMANGMAYSAEVGERPG